MIVVDGKTLDCMMVVDGKTLERLYDGCRWKDLRKIV